ncbi:MAG: cupin domain-containing protein [Bacteroidales bacterium]|jgi:mannose-6-phosphate isomerase-like protein (cupin superfamily)
MIRKVNLQEKFDLITKTWTPIIVGELNGQQVRLVKIKGEFVMHQHEDEDELFLVIKGSMKMDYGDHRVEVGEGEFVIVPRGTNHRPIAENETQILLFEPTSVLNTGDVENELTHKSPKRM